MASWSPTVSVTDAPGLAHAEAMTLAETEYRRFAALVAQLDADEWQRVTICDPWTVRDMASHVLGYMRASSSVGEQVRQVRAARRRGGPVADAMSAVQVEELSGLTGPQVSAEVERLVEPASRGRRKVPWVARRLVRITSDLPVAQTQETWTLGYLVDVIGTRDTWMHRLDICLATGRAPELDHEHDGRLVADIVTEWARRHGRPFQLRLDGPAGGTFQQGENGTPLHDDAIAFCRALSGRGTTVPFDTEVPF